MTLMPKKYAEALFGAAEILGCERAVAGELRDVCGLINRYGKYFNNPMIRDDIKSGMFTEVLDGKIDPVTREFVLLLMCRRHLKYLSAAADIFERLYNKKLGNFTVHLQTAHKPERDVLERIRLKLADIGLIPGQLLEKAVVSVEIVPELIGGFVAYGDGARVDASLKTAFTRIRAR